MTTTNESETEIIIRINILIEDSHSALLRLERWGGWHIKFRTPHRMVNSKESINWTNIWYNHPLHSPIHIDNNSAMYYNPFSLANQSNPKPSYGYSVIESILNGLVTLHVDILFYYYNYLQVLHCTANTTSLDKTAHNLVLVLFSLKSYVVFPQYRCTIFTFNGKHLTADISRFPRHIKRHW